MNKDVSFLDILEGRFPLPPAAMLLGWKTLEVDKEQGYVKGEMQAREEFLNPAGTIQGGFLCAMLDGTLGSAVMCTLGPGQYAPTLEIKTSFLRPARPGILIGEGRIVSKGTGICFVEGTLRDSRGVMIATATATARLLAL